MTLLTLLHHDIAHTMRAFSGDAWALRGTKRVSLGGTFRFGGIFRGILKTASLNKPVKMRLVATGSIPSLAPLIPRNPKRS